MTELINTLYNFLTHHSSAGIWNDPEYENAVACAEKKQTLLDQQLNENQRRLLRELLDELELAHHMEKTQLFQASLALNRELSGLIHP